MKFILPFILLFLGVQPDSTAQTSNPEYDSVLAKKLHADAYGMKKYFLVLLKKGPATITDTARINTIFKGHMQNIQALAAQNKLVVAGPLGKNDKHYEGIFILNTETLKEAETLLQTDPAIHNKLLDAELYLWYGSAALQETLPLHKKIEKEHF